MAVILLVCGLVASLNYLLLCCHVSCFHLSICLGLVWFRLVVVKFSCRSLPVHIICCIWKMFFLVLTVFSSEVFCMGKFSQQFILFNLIFSLWSPFLCNCHLFAWLIASQNIQNLLHRNNCDFRLVFVCCKWRYIFSPTSLCQPIKIHGTISQNPTYLKPEKKVLLR